MKNIKVAVLDERELRFAMLLEDAGLSQSMARVIVCLMVHTGIPVRDIAVAAGMTSAAATVALRKLRESGMVLSEDSVTGRMADRRYRMIGDWTCILSMIEELERRKVSGFLENTGRARSAIENSALSSRPKSRTSTSADKRRD